MVVLILIEILHLLGHLLGVRVLECERPHDLLLRLLRVEGGDEFLDDPEVGFARQDDQGVGAAAGRHLDDILG